MHICGWVCFVWRHLHKPLGSVVAFDAASFPFPVLPRCMIEVPVYLSGKTACSPCFLTKIQTWFHVDTCVLLRLLTAWQLAGLARCVANALILPQCRTGDLDFNSLVEIFFPTTLWLRDGHLCHCAAHWVRPHAASWETQVCFLLQLTFFSKHFSIFFCLLSFFRGTFEALNALSRTRQDVLVGSTADGGAGYLC